MAFFEAMFFTSAPQQDDDILRATRSLSQRAEGQQQCFLVLDPRFPLHPVADARSAPFILQYFQHFNVTFRDFM